MKHDLDGSMYQRFLFGETDWICRACLSIIPDPMQGCQHCQRKQAKAQASLAMLIQRRKETSPCDHD